MKNEAGETQILHAQMDEILTKTIREHSQKEKKLALQTWKARKKCLKLTILVLLILILLWLLTYFGRDEFNNAKIEKADVVIFVQSSTRFFKTDGGWYSPYSDTLQAVLKSENIKYDFGFK